MKRLKNENIITIAAVVTVIFLSVAVFGACRSFFSSMPFWPVGCVGGGTTIPEVMEKIAKIESMGMFGGSVYVSYDYYYELKCYPATGGLLMYYLNSYCEEYTYTNTKYYKVYVGSKYCNDNEDTGMSDLVDPDYFLATWATTGYCE